MIIIGSRCAWETLDLALKYRSRGVVGIDFSGNPAKGDIQEFIPVLKKVKAEGLHLTLHFAEAFNPEESKVEKKQKQKQKYFSIFILILC